MVDHARSLFHCLISFGTPCSRMTTLMAFVISDEFVIFVIVV